MTFWEKLFGGKKKLKKQLEEARVKFGRNADGLKTPVDGEQSAQWEQAKADMVRFIRSESVDVEDKLAALNTVNKQLGVQLDAQNFGKTVNAKRLSHLAAFIRDLADPNIDEFTKRIHTLYQGLFDGKFPCCRSERVDEIFDLVQDFRSAYVSVGNDAKKKEIADKQFTLIDRALRTNDNVIAVINTINTAISELNDSGVDHSSMEIMKTRFKNWEEFVDNSDDIVSNFEAELYSWRQKAESLQKAMEEMGAKLKELADKGRTVELKTGNIKFQQLKAQRNSTQMLVDQGASNQTKLILLKEKVIYIKNSGVDVGDIKNFFKGKTLGEILHDYEKIAFALDGLKDGIDNSIPTVDEYNGADVELDPELQEMFKNMEKEADVPFAETKQTVKDSETNV